MSSGHGISQAFVLAQASAGFGGYALDMLRVLFALALVCALAWGALRLLARRGLGGVFGTRAGRIVEVVERVALEPRRSLYVVRVQGRLLLLGSGDSGPPGLIAELDPDDAGVASRASDADRASADALGSSALAAREPQDG